MPPIPGEAVSSRGCLAPPNGGQGAAKPAQSRLCRRKTLLWLRWLFGRGRSNQDVGIGGRTARRGPKQDVRRVRRRSRPQERRGVVLPLRVLAQRRQTLPRGLRYTPRVLCLSARGRETFDRSEDPAIADPLERLHDGDHEIRFLLALGLGQRVR